MDTMGECGTTTWRPDVHRTILLHQATVITGTVMIGNRIKGGTAPAYGTPLTGVFTFVGVETGTHWLVQTNLPAGAYPYDVKADIPTAADAGASDTDFMTNDRLGMTVVAGATGTGTGFADSGNVHLSGFVKDYNSHPIPGTSIVFWTCTVILFCQQQLVLMACMSSGISNLVVVPESSQIHCQPTTVISAMALTHAILTSHGKCDWCCSQPWQQMCGRLLC
jgi:hypothetical protein